MSLIGRREREAFLVHWTTGTAPASSSSSRSSVKTRTGVLVQQLVSASASSTPIAPEHLFPAAGYDTTDVIRRTLAQPWCSGKIFLAGWSAGGAIALALGSAELIATRYGLKKEESDQVMAAVAFDPPIGGKHEERLAGKTVSCGSTPRDTLASDS